jgi:outer membrane protein assembly factor BamB
LLTPGASAQDFAARFRFHAAPKPLASGAVTEDWPRFLGPRDDATSGETKLLRGWPEGGPALVWELAKGEGYTSPSVAGGRMVYFTRIGGDEVVDCFHPETGEHYWSFSYPVEYRDRYGFSPGPRASPVIDAPASRVFTSGVTAVLHCLELSSGKVVWKRDLMADFQVPKYFFGSGPSPVLHGGLLIQNVGGRDGEGGEGVCVAAFDKGSGETVWTHRDAWGASYASPRVVTLHGKEVLLVFAGGESRPSTGGLLALDPASGRLYDRFPWRSDKFESVNASSPVVLSGDRVLISETYTHGAVCLQFDDDLKASVAWKSPDLRNHWTTPVVEGGHIYSFTGRNEPDASLGCYRASDGAQVWDESPVWTETVRGRERRNAFLRGSVLKVDSGFLALGELGTLGWLELRPDGYKIAERHGLFDARSTWSLPVVHRGLLYVGQHEPDMATDAAPRLLCYDLRAAD